MRKKSVEDRLKNNQSIYVDNYLKNKELNEALEKLPDGENFIPLYGVLILEATSPLIKVSLIEKLAKYHTKEVYDILCKALVDEKNFMCCGSILTALENFEYVDLKEQLADIVCSGNFEASRKAYAMLNKIEGLITTEDKQSFIEKAERELENCNDKMLLLRRFVKWSRT